MPNVFGNLDFGLGGSGDMVRLYSPGLDLIDSVKYTDTAPWPTGADGQGSTLELMNPVKDNALAENWSASSGHGTPGAQNSIFTYLNEREDIKLPETRALFQNYPNPFNPSTVISYQLAVRSTVDLSIYNILGQKVATLISGKQSAGNYEVKWNAAEFSSGVYLSKLTTGDGFTQTKKLVLLK